MKNSLFLILSAFLFWSATCDDDDAVPYDPCSKYYKSLPEATETGRRIFGCEMNGEDWVAYVDPIEIVLGNPPHVESIFNQNFGLMRSSGRRIIQEPGCDTSNQILILIGFTELGESVSLSENTKFTDYFNGCSYRVDSLKSNYIKLTNIDTVSRTISGIFEATLVSQECLDTVVITDGRFDDKY